MRIFGMRPSDELAVRGQVNGAAGIEKHAERLIEGCMHFGDMQRG